MKQKKLKVFGRVWTVKVKERLADTGADGLTLKQEKELWLDSDLKGKEQMQTLLHEFVHAVFVESGLDQTSIRGDLEEIVAEQVSQALVDNFNIKFKP